MSHAFLIVVAFMVSLAVCTLIAARVGDREGTTGAVVLLIIIAFGIVGIWLLAGRPA